MTMAQAALVEPFSVALHAQSIAGTWPDAKIAILGAGPIGLCVLAACRIATPCTTYVTDLYDARLAAAREYGADWTGNVRRLDGVRAVAEHEPLGMDFVFECAGEQATLDQAVEMLKPGGVLVIVGIPESDRIQFDPHALRRKELEIRNVRRQNHRTADAVRMIASGTANLDRLVTHQFPLDQTKAALDLAADYADGVIKAMVHVFA
jgi:L-iditol 2-dehydrogenase